MKFLKSGQSQTCALDVDTDKSHYSVQCVNQRRLLLTAPRHQYSACDETSANILLHTIFSFRSELCLYDAGSCYTRLCTAVVWYAFSETKGKNQCSSTKASLPCKTSVVGCEFAGMCRGAKIIVGSKRQNCQCAGNVWGLPSYFPHVGRMPTQYYCAGPRKPSPQTLCNFNVRLRIQLFLVRRLKLLH